MRKNTLDRVRERGGAGGFDTRYHACGFLWVVSFLPFGLWRYGISGGKRRIREYGLEFVVWELS
jgi:hypothetical protein